MLIEKDSIDIVMPKSLTEGSANSLKLCELFIGGLWVANVFPLTLTVDLKSKSVSCTDQKLRETVRMFVGAGRLDGFAQQLTGLLHETSEAGAIGELRCVHLGTMKRFVIFDLGGASLHWKILSV